MEAHVEKIDVVEKSPCLVEPRRFKISAKTDKPLTDILPIFYLALPASNYSKAHGSLSFLRKGKLIGIFSDGKINMPCFETDDEANEHLADLKNLISRAFEYFAQHGPPDPQLLDIRQKLSPLEIYKYLPKTNCKECGE
jgi:ArsR family metal-binding transcriptional regulator